MALLSFLCLAWCCVFLAVAQEETITCREPTSVTDLYRSLRSRTIQSAAQSQGDESVEEDHQHHHVTVTSLNHTCPHDQQSRICHCPARNELNFDPNRIPKVLVQTRCCSDNQESVSHWVARCTEAYQNVQVLRRADCSQGVFRYRLQWERVPVGCSCRVVTNVFSAP